MAESYEETRATNLRHKGCGGPVVVTHDGEVCSDCGTELRESDWYESSPPLDYTDADRSYDLHAFEQDYGIAP